MAIEVFAIDLLAVGSLRLEPGMTANAYSETAASLPSRYYPYTLSGGITDLHVVQDRFLAGTTDKTTAGDDLFDSIHNNTSLESYDSVMESRPPSGYETDRHDLMRAVQALRYDNKELRGRLKKIIKDVEGRFKSISLDGASLPLDEDLVLPDAYFYE
ncbi:hypothetical protein FOZ62_028858, partial [Perkinsus olseni]